MSQRDPDAVDPECEAINWRRTDDGVELYDETNADAWVHVSWTAGTPPEKRLFSVCPECGAVAAQRGPPGRGTVCGDCGTAYDHALDADGRSHALDREK
ncbi:hypothetical protein [Halovivax sp.]|uniref:hypothetical protein n=1 Tax=Halovivax sp. TaxID=1935978 RepID=UPI0025B880BB|nr:hypothetical protein [Halovivax sp.]